MAQHFTLTVNGQAQTIDIDDPDMPLLTRCATISA